MEIAISEGDEGGECVVCAFHSFMPSYVCLLILILLLLLLSDPNQQADYYVTVVDSAAESGKKSIYPVYLTM